MQKGTALTGTLEINGAAKFGQELTATLTDTNNSGTLTYKWYRSGENAPIATDTDKYTLTADDIGKTITVVVKSSAELGSMTAVTKVVEKADGPALRQNLPLVLHSMRTKRPSQRPFRRWKMRSTASTGNSIPQSTPRRTVRRTRNIPAMCESREPIRKRQVR